MRLSVYRTFLYSAIPLSLSSCASKGGNTDAGLASFNKDSLAAAIRVLASDSFQGRRPFTEGESRTVDYLVKSYKALGLEPGNGTGYTQDVPLVEISPSIAPSLRLESSKGKMDFRNIDDFVLWTERPDSINIIDRNDVVFAGFGIVAPEYHWNDYAGLDVKGKTVLVMVNDPGYVSGDSRVFRGKEMTYYGRWTYKIEEAARQGAAGVLIVHESGPAGYPWKVVRNSWT